MSKLYSNELKALVVPENVLEVGSVLQENCMTVQGFNYDCVRERNNSGDSYGPTNPVILSFTIRVNNPADAKPYYEMLANNASFPLSFLFNATFDDNLRLADYEDGMVTEGYVVSVEQDYGSASGDQTAEEQMRLRVKMLLTSTTYLGRQKNYKSVFIYQN